MGMLHHNQVELLSSGIQHHHVQWSQTLAEVH